MSGTTIGVTAIPVKIEDGIVHVHCNAYQPAIDTYMPKSVFDGFQGIANAVTQRVLAEGSLRPDNPDKSGSNITMGVLCALVPFHSSYPIQTVSPGTRAFEALVEAAKTRQMLPPDAIAAEMLVKLNDLDFQMQVSQRQLAAKPQSKPEQWQVRVEVTGTETKLPSL